MYKVSQGIYISNSYKINNTKILFDIKIKMSACKYNSCKSMQTPRKRLEIDTHTFLEMKFILVDNALAVCQLRNFPDKIDHFQALSLIDWCKVSSTRRGEIRQALRAKGIEQDLADKIKDRRKIEEPKALYEVCKMLYRGKVELESEKIQLIWEIAYFKYKCEEAMDEAAGYS